VDWLVIGILMVAGVYSLILVGIFGKGLIGNTKRMASRLGMGPTRVISAIIGAVLIGLAIAAIFNPGFLGS
jgi:hypothetical protein